MFYSSPTYNIDTKTWSYTDFKERNDAIAYLDKQFKYPGRYDLKYTEGYWNEQGQIWQKTGSYPTFPDYSAEFKKHWNFEKEKCWHDGFIIYKSEKENLEFAVPGLFYFYLNYCPISDKIKRRNDLPEIYDGDYHYFLYILRCILKRKYAVILKKRQSGYSLKNMAIMLNYIWFGKSAITKIFAYLENKVRDSWVFLENYKEHINKHCGWKRGLDPGQKLDWQIRRKLNDGSVVGNLSIAKGFTTQQDPTNGVGGDAALIFGEESGINPTLDVTHEYITSNVSIGGLVTGMIIYSGAVGELDKAEPLKNFILNPEDNNFLACDNEIEEDVEFGPKVGFFAVEWWNYVSVETDSDGNPIGEALRCYDQWGNTDKEKALAEIKKWRTIAEKRKPASYRFYCSQRPLSIKEAFAFRKDSVFPVNLIAKQIQRIEDKNYSFEYVDLKRDEQGRVIMKPSNRLPIDKFPFPEGNADKRGVVVIHERPIKELRFGETYYASIDPVDVGKTTTSKSLCSIEIYKNDTEVKRVENGETTVYIEPGKLVAFWCGRFDDNNDNNNLMEMMLEMYEAWAVVENNISSFITHMKKKKKQKYLVPKSQIGFLKELGANTTSYEEYGWRNTGVIFDPHMINYAIDSLTEVVDEIIDSNGNTVKVVYGVERVTDIMVLKEMLAYYKGLNVDRLITFGSLMSFVKIQQASRGLAKRVEILSGTPEVDPNLYKKTSSFFKQIGNQNSNVPKEYQITKKMFRNLR